MKSGSRKYGWFHVSRREHKSAFRENGRKIKNSNLNNEVKDEVRGKKKKIRKKEEVEDEERGRGQKMSQSFVVLFIKIKKTFF